MTNDTTKNQSSHIPWWRSLRWNVIFALVILAVVPVAVVQLIAYDRFRERTIEQIINQLDSVATLKTAELSGWVRDGQSVMDVFAEASYINKPIQAVLSGQSSGSSLSDQLGTALSDSIGETGILNSLFIYDTQGNVLIASNESDVGKVVSRQPYFKGSIETDDFYIQAPFYDIGNNQLTITISEPIKNASGKLIGIITGRLNIATLTAIMTERAGLGETGETYLVSRENNYLLTSSRFAGYELNRAYRSTGIDNALREIEGSGIYSSYRTSGEDVIGVYRWIPQLQSAMLVEITTDEALSAFYQAMLTGFLGLLVVISLATAIGIILGQRITAPITRLTETAQKIASGALSERAQVKGSNEISLLAKSFNHMTDRLSQSIHELDDKFHELEEVNHQLALKSAQAREATRLKSEFLATMSHELRTPLNAITGFTGILLFDEDDMSEDNVHMLKRIESNSERLLKLIDDVLDLSKIEAGRVEIVEESIQIQQLVERWRSELGVLADKKGIRFDVDVDPALPDVIIGDSARLTQITNNLISNAVKFTAEGAVELSVFQQNNNWIIKVKDSGIGIPPHAQNYIFDEFRQVDGSSRRIYGGTGLGLAITRNLCLMMGGKVTVDSELGKGSTFTVTLPLKVAERNAIKI